MYLQVLRFSCILYLWSTKIIEYKSVVFSLIVNIGKEEFLCKCLKKIFLKIIVKNQFDFELTGNERNIMYKG